MGCSNHFQALRCWKRTSAFLCRSSSAASSTDCRRAPSSDPNHLGSQLPAMVVLSEQLCGRTNTFAWSDMDGLVPCDFLIEKSSL